MARTPRPIPARVRILAAILAVACVGLAIVGSVTFLVQRQQAISAVNERLRTQVAALTALAEDPGASGASRGAAAAAEELDPDEYETVDEYLYAIVARLVPARNEASLALIDGAPRWVPSTFSGFSIADDKEFLDRVVAETSGGETKSGTAVTDERSLRYIAIPVSMDGDPRQGLYVRAVDLGAELQPVTTAMATYVIAAVAVLGAIGIVGWFVTGRLLSPIRHLRDTADAISISDLSLRLEPQGNDDIADLSRTVNSMLDRLEGSVDGQRQLLDDVRHELKTPITIVRGHLELMNPSDVDDVAAAREIGIAELDRLTRLVEDIDVLATAEAESYTLAEVDLGSLTARVGELVAVIPGHTWRVEAIADGATVGDQDRLLQAWLQLADNAAKYTPTGSPNEIGSARDAAGARLWVRDHGPGIPTAARTRIFQRFNRAHVKRSVGGSGLGLAIVDAIAKGHGGHCSVTDTDGGGATFTIHLPPVEADLPAPVRAGDVVLQREASG